MSRTLVTALLSNERGALAVVAESVLKARLLYDHTVPSVTRSDNISSVTDGGAGIATHNFTGAFTDANYVRLSTSNMNGNEATFAVGSLYRTSTDITNTTASACPVHSTSGAQATDAAADMPAHTTVYQGDLA